MTVDIRLQVMTVITARTVSVIIVRSVRHIVRYVTRLCVWVVVLNVPIAENLFAGIVPQFVKNATRHFVRIVSMKKDYAKVVKIKERIKIMKNRKKNQQNQRPVLRFSPTAWAKLLFMRDVTDNEVGGFGITKADDLLFVTDFVLVKQKVTTVSVSFDDEAVADYFEDQVEIGRQPEQFGRIWLHSHPGDSPEPSYTDEQTFARVFGSCDWAIMFIVAQDGKTFAMLRFNAGPGGEVKIPVCVDYSYEFNAADFEVWQQQYLANVVEDTVFSLNGKTKKSRNDQLEEAEVFGSTGFDSLAVSSSEDMIEELELMHPSERQAFMDELAVRSDFWDEYESEV
jgi:proteasome lid subunit RPN8/RPN11